MVAPLVVAGVSQAVSLLGKLKLFGKKPGQGNNCWAIMPDGTKKAGGCLPGESPGSTHLITGPNASKPGSWNYAPLPSGSQPITHQGPGSGLAGKISHAPSSGPSSWVDKVGDILTDGAKLYDTAFGGSPSYPSNGGSGGLEDYTPPVSTGERAPSMLPWLLIGGAVLIGAVLIARK